MICVIWIWVSLRRRGHRMPKSLGRLFKNSGTESTSKVWVVDVTT